MASITSIRQDAQDIVRLSTSGLKTLKALELDTITYYVKDKEGKTVATYVTRDQRQAAYDDADQRNFAEDEGWPFRVEAESNLQVDESGEVTFEIGSMVDLQLPVEEIKAAAQQIEKATDCATIQELIKQGIQTLMDMILANQRAAADCTPYGELLKIPSNPLKIISWVKKFVSMYLGPQIMALVDILIQLAYFLDALQQLINAATAAEQKLKLCAEGLDEFILQTIVDEAIDAINEANPKIDPLLKQLNTFQTDLALVTGKPPAFDISQGTRSLVQSVANGAKEQFKSDVAAYGAAPLEDVSISLTMTGDVTGTASTDENGNFTISTTAPPPPASTTVTVLDENGDPLEISVFAP